eukprot:4486154-Karenia_brevis.AAC.1
MRDYVKNYNARNKAVADTKRPLLEQLRTHVSKWSEKHGQLSLNPEDLSALKVLEYIRKPVLEKDRIYVPFACRGMLDTLTHVGRVELVVDANKNLFARTWG